MRLKRWFAGKVMGRMADLTRQRRREVKLEQQQGRVPTLHYFHQVDDPYSHLIAQLLPDLLKQFPVPCVFHLVPPAADDVAPERAMLANYARRDAAAIAPWYGLFFVDPEHAPRTDLVTIAQCILSAQKTPDPDLPRQVGLALWENDAIVLQELAARHGFADVPTMSRKLITGDRKRTKWGYFGSAAFYFDGTWYVGIERLHYLQRRLVSRGLGAPPKRLALPQRSGFNQALNAQDLVLECFVSLRSPYTWLAMERLKNLTQKHGVQIVLRPVLPMVMRGLPVPARKGAYLMFDAAREAQMLGVPFGRIFDPLGGPVLRALSLFDWVRSKGQEFGFFHALLRATFAEGRDIYQTRVLQQIIGGLGLSWQEAQSHLDKAGWEAEVEHNRLEMANHDCWGVPSFILRRAGQSKPLCVTWGQDRLWLIEETMLQYCQSA
jgi:2-hydroxychromene-2-carboxylate isomerase